MFYPLSADPSTLISEKRYLLVGKRQEAAGGSSRRKAARTAYLCDSLAGVWRQVWAWYRSPMSAFARLMCMLFFEQMYFLTVTGPSMKGMIWTCCWWNWMLVDEFRDNSVGGETSRWSSISWSDFILLDRIYNFEYKQHWARPLWGPNNPPYGI